MNLVYLAIIITISIITFDMLKKINLMHKACLSLFLIFMPHIFIIRYYIFRYTRGMPISHQYTIYICIFILFIYVWIKINVFPIIGSNINKRRVKILFSGIKLILYGIYTLIMQIIICLNLYYYIGKHNIDIKVIVWDSIVTLMTIIMIISNGIIRILCTSKKFNNKDGNVIMATMFIPIVNLITIIYVYRMDGYKGEKEIYRLDEIQIESDICSTKYPIILIHGVGFRDFTYLNYWGRIPNALIKNGADIYYGSQEAFGTVEHNAYNIKKKILQVIRETGAEKVNIIAHSKGGLDARYAISRLNMGRYVASLTTISSPHKGVRFVDYACRFPERFYRFVAKTIDKYFLSIGDDVSDFYSSTRMFSTEASRKFNEKVKDVEGIYYQSYASVMKNMFSDYVLSIPFLLIKLTEGRDNDGLVSVESAKWGNFKEAFMNNVGSRGISHGDIVDFRREDYKGFNVVEKYIEIVSELKNMGY